MNIQEFLENHLTSNHEYEANQSKVLIANNDFVGASKVFFDAMVWQYNQEFAKYFNLEDLDSIKNNLMSNLTRNIGSVQSIQDLAQRQAWTEQYKFVLKVEQKLAKSNK